MDRCSFFSSVSRLLPFIKLGKIRDKVWPVMGSMILVTRALISSPSQSKSKLPKNLEIIFSLPENPHACNLAGSNQSVRDTTTLIDDLGSCIQIHNLHSFVSVQLFSASKLLATFNYNPRTIQQTSVIGNAINIPNITLQRNYLTN